MNRELDVSHTVISIEKVQSWLLSNKWGRLFLIVLASFYLTPKKFVAINEGEKNLYARLQSKQVICTTSLVIGAIASSTILQHFKSHFPNVDGFSGAEYFDFIIKVSHYGFGSGLFWTVLVILLYSLCELAVNHFVVWLEEKMGNLVTPVPIHYFVIMNASLLFGLALLGWLGVAVFISPDLLSLELLFELIEEHPFYTLIACYGIMWIESRRTQIKKDTARQLYPHIVYRILGPLAAFILFITSLWGILMGITKLLLLLSGGQ